MHFVFTLALATLAALTNLRHARAHGLIEAPARGLIVRGSRGPGDVTAAGRFAEVFHPRFGLTLVLWSAHGGVETPAFSGLVTDAEQNVVANFKLVSVDHVEDVHAALKRAIDRARRFAEVGAWDAVRAKSDGRWRAKSTASLDHLVEVFDVPSRRPTWVLIDSKDARDVGAARATAILRLTKNAGPVALTLIRRGDTLVTIANGRAHAEILPPCQGNLDH